MKKISMLFIGLLTIFIVGCSSTHDPSLDHIREINDSTSVDGHWIGPLENRGEIDVFVAHGQWNAGASSYDVLVLHDSKSHQTWTVHDKDAVTGGGNITLK